MIRLTKAIPSITLEDIRFLSISSWLALTKAIEIERRETTLELANSLRVAMCGNRETYASFARSYENVIDMLREPYDFGVEESEDDVMSDAELRSFGVDIM